MSLVIGPVRPSEKVGDDGGRLEVQRRVAVGGDGAGELGVELAGDARDRRRVVRVGRRDAEGLLVIRVAVGDDEVGEVGVGGGVHRGRTCRAITSSSVRPVVSGVDVEDLGVLLVVQLEVLRGDAAEPAERQVVGRQFRPGIWPLARLSAIDVPGPVPSSVGRRATRPTSQQHARPPPAISNRRPHRAFFGGGGVAGGARRSGVHGFGRVVAACCTSGGRWRGVGSMVSRIADPSDANGPSSVRPTDPRPPRLQLDPPPGRSIMTARPPLPGDADSPHVGTERPTRTPDPHPRIDRRPTCTRPARTARPSP